MKHGEGCREERSDWPRADTADGVNSFNTSGSTRLAWLTLGSRGDCPKSVSVQSANTPALMNTQTYWHWWTHKHTSTDEHTNVLTLMNTQTYWHQRTHTTYQHWWTHKHTRTDKHKCTSTHEHTYIGTDEHILALMNINRPVLMNKHTSTDEHTNIPALMNTQTH